MVIPSRDWRRCQVITCLGSADAGQTFRAVVTRSPISQEGIDIPIGWNVVLFPTDIIHYSTGVL